MRIIYLGDSSYRDKCLDYLVEKGIEVVAAPKHSQKELPPELENIDLIISYGFKERIEKPLIELPEIGCINFHPAPLPEYRGMGGVYNFAIFNNEVNWGVSVHFVDENFDTGDIIKILRFEINPREETAFSLKGKSHLYLFRLFKMIIDLVCVGDSLPRTPQGEGHTVTRQDFEVLRRVTPIDPAEEVDRKIRAFWCPPHEGAVIKIEDRDFTLVNKEILDEVGKKYAEYRGNEIKLHIGCGERYIPGFIHIDIREFPHVDYVTTADDLSMFCDGSVDLIYSACLLEHLKRDRVAATLREWYRVLRPGGTVRISVPDFEKIVEVYQKTKSLKPLLGLLIGRQDYPENTHFTVYDFSYLSEVLTDAGFKNVRRYDWRQTIHKDYDDFSQAYIPHMDKEHGELMSLNVEAGKWLKSST